MTTTLERYRASFGTPRADAVGPAVTAFAQAVQAAKNAGVAEAELIAIVGYPADTVEQPAPAAVTNPTPAPGTVVPNAEPARPLR